MRRAAALVVVTALAAACGSAGRPAPREGIGTPPAATTSDAATPTGPVIGFSTPNAVASPTPTASARAARPTKLLVVVLENHSRDEAMNQMPYLRALAHRYAYATAYTAVTHPSLPNYLAIAGGSTFGIRDDKYPSAHPLSGPTVFDQALATHRTARVYAEGMPSTCYTANYRRYAVRHNPWPYFASTSVRASCRRYDVAAGTATSGAYASAARGNALPTVGMLVPDVCHDGHDCSLAVADGWLKAWLAPALASSDFRLGRLAVVVTFDEDDSSQRNRVLTVVAAAQLRSLVVGRALSHLGLSRWMSQMSGSPGLRAAATAPSLGTALGLA